MNNNNGNNGRAIDRGTFGEDPSTFLNNNFVPKSANEQFQEVTGYFDITNHYNTTCPYLAASINYPRRKMTVFLIPPPHDGLTVPQMNADDLTSGDILIELTYSNQGWEEFIENMGTFEQMQQRIEAVAPEGNIPLAGGKRSKRRSRRATRKLKRKSRRRAH